MSNGDLLEFEQPKFSLPDFNITDPEASGLTAGAMIILALAGFGTVWMIDQNIILGPQWEWVPLSVLLFLMLANPIVTLSGIQEAIVVVLSWFTFISYVAVFHSDKLGDIALFSVMMLLVIIVLEFPRRFSLGD